jgi:hypothetical protein
MPANKAVLSGYIQTILKMMTFYTKCHKNSGMVPGHRQT